MKYLDSLETDNRAVVLGYREDAADIERLCDIGLTRGAVIECIGVSPLGDPRAYLIRGAVIALRDRDARSIIIGRAADEGKG